MDSSLTLWSTKWKCTEVTLHFWHIYVYDQGAWGAYWRGYRKKRMLLISILYIFGFSIAWGQETI